MRDPGPARLRDSNQSDSTARESSLSLVKPVTEPRLAWVLGMLMMAVLLPRLWVLPFNQNYYGDAVIRTELAERWAASPHWITSFADGTYQFGPLHIYLLGIALKIFWSREHVGAVVSLLFAVLTVIPLYSLTRRLFGWRAGIVSCLAFSVWGMHIQFSTTAGSEALGLFLVMIVLALFADGLEDGRFTPFIFSALVLNLACATRYDYWLLAPLLTALLFIGDRDRIAATTRAILFGLLCLPFPLMWMHGNEIALGDPLYPIRFIEHYHQNWAKDGIAAYGVAGFRVVSLFFWPGTAFFTLTPPIAFFGIAGMIVTLRQHRERRWLLWVCWLPTAYFTFKSAVLMNFMPLARFAVFQVALVLPFIEPGFQALFGKSSVPLKRAVVAITTVIAVAFPLWLGVFTFEREGKFETSLRPVSPTSTIPPPVMQVARFVKAQIWRKGGSLILDSDAQYNDLQIAFFGNLPETQMARHRWEDFPKLLARLHPAYLVRIEHGSLEKELPLSADGHQATFDGSQFDELPGFMPPYHVYHRR